MQYIPTVSSLFVRVACVAALATGVACEGKSTPNQNDDSADGGTDGDTDGEECDPVGADPDQAALLNAPVSAEVEVIVKQPQHPGPAGPDDLP